MKIKALKAAFPHTIPILTAFAFLGMAYGLYTRVSGLGFVYPLMMSVGIFGGSLEFVTVTMLLSPFAPVQAFLMALLIQARHMFYGIAMLDRYKGMGLKKYYLIFAMCDETFSINCTADIPEDVDRGWFYFFVSLLNQSYWVISAVIGNLLGGFIDLNIQGIDFVMTAMFVVIFLNQWFKEKRHLSSWIGLAVSVLCLIVFGPDSFLIPSMVCIVILLALLKKQIEGKEEKS